MLADEVPGAEMHEPGIEAAMLPGRPPGEERGTRAPIHDDVAVAAPQRQVPGVEVLADGPGPEHRHIGREVRVAAAHPGTDRPGSGGIEVHDLAEGMHAGVGASGADHPNRRRRDPGQRLLHLALNRPPGGLTLETVKSAAVVLQPERDAHPVWPIAVQRRSIQSPGSCFMGASWRACMADQASFESISRAVSCCSASPSASTASRNPRALSVSPISM